MFDDRNAYIRKIIVGGEEIVIFFHRIPSHANEKSLTILDCDLRPTNGYASLRDRYEEDHLFSLAPVPDNFPHFRVPFKEAFDPKTGDLIGRYIAVPYSKFVSQVRPDIPINDMMIRVSELFSDLHYGEGGFPIRDLTREQTQVVSRILELFLVREEHFKTLRWNKLKPLFSNPLKTTQGPALVGLDKQITFRTTEGAYSIRVCRAFYWNTVMTESQRSIYRSVHNMLDDEDPSQDTFPQLIYRISHARKSITIGHTNKVDKRRSEFSTLTIPYKPPTSHPISERIVPYVLFPDVGVVIPNLSLKTGDQSKMLHAFRVTEEQDILFEAASMQRRGPRSDVTAMSTELSWEDYSYQKRCSLGEEEEFDGLETLLAWTSEAQPTVHELPFRNWSEFLNVIESPITLSMEQARDRKHYLLMYYLSTYKLALGRKKSALKPLERAFEDID